MYKVYYMLFILWINIVFLDFEVEFIPNQRSGFQIQIPISVLQIALDVKSLPTWKSFFTKVLYRYR